MNEDARHLAELQAKAMIGAERVRNAQEVVQAAKACLRAAQEDCALLHSKADMMRRRLIREGEIDA